MSNVTLTVAALAVLIAVPMFFMGDNRTANAAPKPELPVLGDAFAPDGVWVDPKNNCEILIWRKPTGGVAAATVRMQGQFCDYHDKKP